MIRVLIAAPTPALRAGLRALVATTELQIVGVAATLAALDLDIADVDVMMLVAGNVLQQLIPCFTGRCFGAEKLGAHIVVDPNDTVPVLSKPFYRFGTNEPG